MLQMILYDQPSIRNSGDQHITYLMGKVFSQMHSFEYNVALGLIIIMFIFLLNRRYEAYYIRSSSVHFSFKLTK